MPSDDIAKLSYLIYKMFHAQFKVTFMDAQACPLMLNICLVIMIVQKSGQVTKAIIVVKICYMSFKILKSKKG